MNQNQGSIVTMISTGDVDAAIITHRGATTGEDGPCPEVQLAGKNKELFDIAIEEDTFFEAWDVIRINHGKSPIYEMASAFDS